MLDVNDPNRNRPLWAVVTETIQMRIDSGFYPLGSVLPREIDLAEELNVSRNTIRHALGRLTTEGFLERRRRGGTRIASLGPSMKFRLDLDPQSSLKALSQGSELQVLSRRSQPLPDDMRGFWPNAEEGLWHCVECLRITSPGKKPLSSTTVYLAPDLEDISLLVGTRRGQQFRFIEEQHHEHMKRTKTSFEPALVDVDSASLLDVPAGTLALRVHHAMLDDQNRAREIVASLYPSQRYKFELTFNLESETGRSLLLAEALPEQSDQMP